MAAGRHLPTPTPAEDGQDLRHRGNDTWWRTAPPIQLLGHALLLAASECLPLALISPRVGPVI